jgi:hypothetical protein
MNYQKIYNQIIDRARNRNLEGYKERHHILPKCLEGSNKKENLVELTAREHFIGHWLLCRVYPQDRKLAKAFNMMCQGKNIQQQRYVPSSRTIQEAKELDREARKGIKKSQESIEKRTATRIERGNYIRTRESVEKGILTKQIRGNLSYGPLSKEHREKLSKIKEKPIVQYTLNGEVVADYKSLSIAASILETSISGISRAATGKVESYKGFIWKYA